MINKMEAHVIACAIKDGYIEDINRNSVREKNTIRSLVKQGWLVGIEDGSFISSHGNKVYRKFKFDLDKAYYR